MSLVADYGSNSDSNSSNSSEEDPNPTKIKSEIKTEDDTSSDEDKTLPLPSFKLPTPKFSGEAQDDQYDDSSGLVFINPFLEAENAKEAILQKHVKMVNAKKDVIRINGKKICWNYRKGRCRFGHNCKYAHDSDVQKTEQQLNEELEVAKVRAVVCHYSGSNSAGSGQKNSPQDDTEEIPEDPKKKRKRPGLTQGLVPGKKVMKQYLHNKS